jgi:hypothetical protein
VDRSLGAYSLHEPLGRGASGEVWRGASRLDGSAVAVKVLRPELADDPDAVARLLGEREVLTGIESPHLVPVRDVVVEGDAVAVVMDLAAGVDLRRLLRSSPTQPPALACDIAAQVAAGLAAVHEAGVVHRDVKPENVFLIRRNERDFVKVVDFGISKLVKGEDDEHDPSGSPRLTQTGMVLGTPLYMSPEQARGEDDLDHRIDIYALGVILYECLTGEVPFHGTNYLNIISQVLSQSPKPLGQARPDLEISPALEAVVLKAMAKDRAQRYQTMAELDADLARVERGDQVDVGSRARARKPAWGPLALWGGTALVVVAGVALAVPRLVGEPAARTEPPAPSVAPPVPAPADPRPRKTIEMITVKVLSQPSGAEVLWGSAPQCTTPCEKEFPRGDERIELVLRLAGYQEARLPLFPTENMKHEVRLEPLPPEKPVTRPGKPTKPKGDGKPGPGVKPPTDPTGGEIPPSPFQKK